MEQAIRKPQRPTMDQYSDYELFGPRLESNRYLDRIKIFNDSECVLFAIGTFASKEKYKLKDLFRTDNRLDQMLKGLKVTHPWPVQRYAWPKIDNSQFATLIVSPEATGKTDALLLYLVSKCILASPIGEAKELVNSSDDKSSKYVPIGYSDLDEYVIHPKHIVVTSSEDNIDSINRRIDLMKQHAYGATVTDAQRRILTPIARAIHVHHDDAKLAMRCNESEIIISNPKSLNKCLDQGLLDFAKCKKVFFDDLDIAMQTQNDEVRKIMTKYIRQTSEARLANMRISGDSTRSQPDSVCQMYMFSRKWTSLVRTFVTNVFSDQRNILFTSLAEAAIYSDVRFNIEFCENESARLSKISDAITVLVGKAPKRKIAIVCRTDMEAEATSKWLTEHNHKVKLLKAEDNDQFDRPRSSGFVQRTSKDLLFVISDAALEFEVEYSTRRKPLNDVMHLIHAFIPDDMLSFDQRFRVLYRNIQDSKPDMTSTIFLDRSLKSNIARQIYDLISRSGLTLPSTKLDMRDFISRHHLSDVVCWRWATTGLCRFEKLSSNDQFGSYCFERHAFPIKQRPSGEPHNDLGNGLVDYTGWPSDGLVKFTIKHIVSPSEFYFWFEGTKCSETGKWSNFETAGKNFMKSLEDKLNPLRATKPRSVALENIKRGRIYGVHFPEERRVDRVRLLDDFTIETKNAAMINKDLEYSKQVRVSKIDYGPKLEVYVRNLIELPDEIRRVPAQGLRAFQLGYKPVNKIKWSDESKKQFYDIVESDREQTISAWLRFNCDGNFWFEKMTVCWRLNNIDSPDVHSVDPHRQLLQLNLAKATSDEPAGMPASRRIQVYRRWEQRKLIEASQYAFIDKSASRLKVHLLTVTHNLDLVLRLVKFDEQLRLLENLLATEFANGKLEQQEHFEIGTLCLAKIDLQGATCINRVKVGGTSLEQGGDIESPDSAPVRKVSVECLDHGDINIVTVDQLYKAELAHISKLPFQMIKCKFANLNPELIVDPAQATRIGDKIVSLSRDADNIYEELICKADAQGGVYLYLPRANEEGYIPLWDLLFKDNIVLHTTIEEEFTKEIDTEIEHVKSDGCSAYVLGLINNLLHEMAREEIARFASELKDSQRGATAV